MEKVEMIATLVKAGVDFKAACDYVAAQDAPKPQETAQKPQDAPKPQETAQKPQDAPKPQETAQKPQDGLEKLFDSVNKLESEFDKLVKNMQENNIRMMSAEIKNPKSADDVLKEIWG